MNKKNKANAFSYVEMIVTIAVVTIIITVGMPYFAKDKDKSSDNTNTALPNSYYRCRYNGNNDKFLEIKNCNNENAPIGCDEASVDSCTYTVPDACKNKDCRFTIHLKGGGGGGMSAQYFTQKFSGEKFYYEPVNGANGSDKEIYNVDFGKNVTKISIVAGECSGSDTLCIGKGGETTAARPSDCEEVIPAGIHPKSTESGSKSCYNDVCADGGKGAEFVYVDISNKTKEQMAMKTEYCGIKTPSKELSIDSLLSCNINKSNDNPGQGGISYAPRCNGETVKDDERPSTDGAGGSVEIILQK